MRSRELDGIIGEIGVRDAGKQESVAGLLFTYRCSIACRHCLFGCASGMPDVAMTPRQCADALALLHETNRVVHVAGGEAMMYWEQFWDSLALAHEEGNAPHFVETNCSFAVNERAGRHQLRTAVRRHDGADASRQLRAGGD